MRDDQASKLPYKPPPADHFGERKTFKLEIECAAFDDDAAIEIAFQLREIAVDIRDGGLHPNSAQWIRDANGNRVGTWKFEDRGRWK
jgi:hypothetical protein